MSKVGKCDTFAISAIFTQPYKPSILNKYHKSSNDSFKFSKALFCAHASEGDKHQIVIDILDGVTLVEMVIHEITPQSIKDKTRQLVVKTRPEIAFLDAALDKSLAEFTIMLIPLFQELHNRRISPQI